MFLTIHQLNFIQYRFFELAIGGLAAIYFNDKTFKINKKNQILLLVLVLLLIGLLFFSTPFGNTINILLVTTGILILGDFQFQKNKLYMSIFENKIITGIGKISFSIYMWHQIVFSFYRYVKSDDISILISIVLIIIIFLFSIGTYYLIENPFRNKKRRKTKQVLIILSVAFILIISSSFYVYLVGGVVRDVPELGLKYKIIPEKLNFFNSSDNIQRHYNEKVRSLDKPFFDNNKIKVLVIGNSFGRDFANVLLESSFKDKIEVRYFEMKKLQNNNFDANRLKQANHIFIANDKFISKELIKTLESQKNIKILNKILVVGTKDFGYSNEKHYNYIKNNSFNNYSYRTSMKKGVLEENEKLKAEWNNQFIDLIALVSDDKGRGLVFTPSSKFISQDTRHFTKFGVSYFAEILNKQLKNILLQ